MLSIKNLSIEYESNNNVKKVLNNVFCSFEKGKITLLTGKSGAGKSSLLSAVAQLNLYKGIIEFDQNNLKNLSDQERARTLGYVAQEFNLFNHLTTVQNCIQPLQMVLGMSYPEAYERVMNLFTYFEIESLVDSYPHQLSGGQQQRVALIRAMVFQPKVLLLDEPTSALDFVMVNKVADYLKKIAAQGTAIIIISHDIKFTEEIADKIYYINEGALVKQ